MNTDSTIPSELERFAQRDNPPVTVEEINSFCQLVAQRNYEQAAALCLDIITKIGMETIQSSVQSEEITHAMTLLASGITNMLADPKFYLNDIGVRAFLVNKRSLRRIFSATSFKDMSHLFSLIASQGGDGKATISSNDWWRLMIIMSLDNLDDPLFQILENMNPELQMLLWASLLDIVFVVSEHEQKNLDRLIEAIHKVKLSPCLSIGEADLFHRVWFRCSYWDNPNRHEVKRFLNVAFSEGAKIRGVKLNSAKEYKPSATAKPKLLVVHEAWTKSHAMYRCYAKAYEPLRKQFQVTALVEKTKTHIRATDMFDDVVFFSQVGDLKETAIQIEQFEPDLILFSSIGMHPQSNFLAQLRLAPIQMMTLGHPASSFSDMIDYVIVEEECAGALSRLHEKVLLLENGTFSMSKPINPIARAVKNPTSLETGVIKIVCNSMYHKITPKFIEICATIQESTERELEWIFLAGTDALSYRQMNYQVQPKLTNATIKTMMPYHEYSEVIAECDLQLTPFPFGNTNGFIDAMMLGIPTVCMDGDELMSHSDVIFGRRVGLPEFLQTSSVMEYVQAALKLINDDSSRAALRESILNKDIDALFFDRNCKREDDLSHLVSWIYKNHGHVRNSEKKVWSVSDRDTLFVS